MTHPARLLPYVLLFACTTMDITDEESTADNGDADTDADADSDTDADSDADTDTDTDTDTGQDVPVDTDGDGVLDDEDNCPEVDNPGQENLDGDSMGDACDDDLDGDGIDNAYDPFEADPDRPGRATLEAVYAHTSSQLFALDVVTEQLTALGTFPMSSVTDIAIDAYGVLYAITFSNLYVCNPDTMECWLLGSLPGSSNGLTFVPAGAVNPTMDTLIGIAQDGTWSAIDWNGTTATYTNVGGYGGGIGSAGDVFYLEGEGSFAAVRDPSRSGTTIVEVNPADGSIIRVLNNLADQPNIWGLGGWQDVIYAFDSSGDIVRMDPVTGTSTVLMSTSNSWWGAGVRTSLTPL